MKKLPDLELGPLNEPTSKPQVKPKHIRTKSSCLAPIPEVPLLESPIVKDHNNHNSLRQKKYLNLRKLIYYRDSDFSFLSEAMVYRAHQNHQDLNDSKLYQKVHFKTLVDESTDDSFSHSRKKNASLPRINDTSASKHSESNEPVSFLFSHRGPSKTYEYPVLSHRKVKEADLHREPSPYLPNPPKEPRNYYARRVAAIANHNAQFIETEVEQEEVVKKVHFKLPKESPPPRKELKGLPRYHFKRTQKKKFTQLAKLPIYSNTLMNNQPENEIVEKLQNFRLQDLSDLVET